MEIDSMDLAYVLATEDAPRFLAADTDCVSWGPIFEVHDRLQDADFIDCLVDPRLVAVCRDLRHLINMVNENSIRKTRVSGHLFQPVISSIRSRLLKLRGDISDLADECLRLGILAFLTTTTFQSPTGGGNPCKDPGALNGTTKRRPYIASHLRNACQAVETSTPHLRKLLFWVLTICAMSVFDIHEEHWLVEKWRYILKEIPLGVSPWESAKAELKSVFWIDCVNNGPGRKVFDQLTGGRITTYQAVRN